jgi:1,4-alpha-glucan branching enzyme
VGVPAGGYWKEIFNSDSSSFGGSSTVNDMVLKAIRGEYHGKDHAVTLVLPPLGLCVLKLERDEEITDLKKT